jgi:hypothetical protein
MGDSNAESGRKCLTRFVQTVFLVLNRVFQSFGLTQIPSIAGFFHTWKWKDDAMGLGVGSRHSCGINARNIHRNTHISDAPMSDPSCPDDDRAVN